MEEEKEITQENTGLTPEQEKQLEDAIKEQLENVRNGGLIHGARMVAGIVLGFARDKKHPYNQRLNRIIEFCNTIMSNTQKRAEEIGVNVGGKDEE